MAYRKEKLEELIKRVTSELIINEIKDPRIGFVTITGVSLSKDYSKARVGISVIGTPREIRKSLEGLKSAEGFIQHRVGKSIKIRTVPRIEFFLDSSVADGVEMVDKLENLVEGDSEMPGEENSDQAETNDI